MRTGERAVTFGCEGHTLVGVVSGSADTGELGMLLTAGAPQYRVGAHRQFVMLARRLSQAGIATMRFDYRGIGDSGGDPQDFRRTAPDIKAAIDAFQDACPSVERVVLAGLCDGASASLLYWHATSDTRIVGMVLMNPWITSDERFAQSQITKALKRVLHRDFWMKLIRGDIDLVAAIRAFAGAIERVFTRERNAGVDAKGFPQRMAEGMENFEEPVLVVLSGRDLVSSEFLAQCRSDPRWRKLMGRSNVKQTLLPDADHTFSMAVWRLHVEATIVEWLDRLRTRSRVKQLA